MRAAQREGGAREGEELLVRMLPIHPREVGIVTVGIVVAELRAAELVAMGEERHALRERERGQHAARHARAPAEDARVRGWPLDAPVAGAVVVRAVAALFAVRVVVLAIMADEIAQRHPVMARDEVDARERIA